MEIKDKKIKKLVDKTNSPSLDSFIWEYPISEIDGRTDKKIGKRIK